MPSFASRIGLAAGSTAAAGLAPPDRSTTGAGRCETHADSSAAWTAIAHKSTLLSITCISADASTQRHEAYRFLAGSLHSTASVLDRDDQLLPFVTDGRDDPPARLELFDPGRRQFVTSCRCDDCIVWCR